jgi:hypothetical protein
LGFSNRRIQRLLPFYDDLLNWVRLAYLKASRSDRLAATTPRCLRADAHSDEEIAAVSNDVIGHFGGKQGKVTAAEVRRLA